MKSHTVPTFAIIGHPNEGKSSVLSTLAEDDSVRISPIPGETVTCQTFPVRIDNREVIRFIDTPGFQNPRKTLQWLQAYEGPEEETLQAFVQTHAENPEFRDDCELLGPVIAGAGIIFVVDGSRPVRNVDRAEMEILRLSGAARMAVINSKEEDSAHLDQWQSAFRKHFNSIRVFNSCKATYAQRIELLESLKSIDQELEPVLKTVISAFREDWTLRNQRTATAIVTLLDECLGYRRSRPFRPGDDEQRIRQKLQKDCIAFITSREKETQQEIRSLFKHNIFNIELPEHSVLLEDLFSEKTWEFLGLTEKQIILAGTLGGAAIGAGIDVSAGGITFGVFSALGGLLGAAGSALKGRDLLSGIQFLGFRAGEEQLQVGPVNNIQLLYILIDRCLLFYNHVINWAHGRRDYQQSLPTGGQPGKTKAGFTTHWNPEAKKTCQAYYKAVTGGNGDKKALYTSRLHSQLLGCLEEIAEDNQRQQSQECLPQ